MVNVQFLTERVRWGWRPTDKRLGATQQMIVQTARRLAARGHDVEVICDGAYAVIDGVRYCSYSEMLEDVVVNVNLPYVKVPRPTVHLSTFWPVPQAGLARFDAVLAVSDWHAAQIHHPDVRVCSPGWDDDGWHQHVELPRRPMVLYTSSPDRGLSELLRAWPQVQAARPDAELVVTYGAKTPDTAGVTCGEYTDRQMRELYHQAAVWCHPCTGPELYCVSAVKAQVAQAWPVFYPHMALSETVKFGTHTTPDRLAEDLILALRSRPRSFPASFPTWDDATDVLERALHDVQARAISAA